MTNKYEEPKYINVKRDIKLDQKEKNKSIETIKNLCRDQSFAVLSTQGMNGCYSSLISFAINEDYSTMVFATPIDTKKIEFIKKNSGVSVLIDNRNDNPNDINDIVAVTVIGNARILEKNGNDLWTQLLIDKHNYLESFAVASTTAIVIIDISKYLFVSSFQEVIEWCPL